MIGQVQDFATIQHAFVDDVLGQISVESCFVRQSLTKDPVAAICIIYFSIFVHTDKVLICILAEIVVQPFWAVVSLLGFIGCLFFGCLFFAVQNNQQRRKL